MATIGLMQGPQSIGKVRANNGNFGVLVRAYTYIRTYGPDGLLHVAQSAILNANYLKHELATDYEIAYPQICQHEFVATAERQKDEYGVTALDIAKRILDFGMYAPTIYFPLIVHEALMIEPTETETRETLDYFVSVMRQIAEEARTNPEIVQTAPAYDTRWALRPGFGCTQTQPALDSWAGGNTLVGEQFIAPGEDLIEVMIACLVPY